MLATNKSCLQLIAKTASRPISGRTSAKCWKPRSLSTPDTNNIAAARPRRNQRDFLFTGRRFSHLHRRRHLRLDGELHQLVAVSSLGLRHNSVALASPAPGLPLRWPRRSAERRRARTGHVVENCHRRSAPVHVAGVRLSCRTRPRAPFDFPIRLLLSRCYGH